MEEAIGVDVVEGRRDLLDDVADLLVGEGIIVQLPHLHHAVQIHIQQLEHHIQCVVMPQHLCALDNVWMSKADHSFDLRISHGSFPRLKLTLECLQSKFLLGELFAD